MLVPTTFHAALLMTVLSTVCWGSFANTFKGTRNYRFELYYWDYGIGIFLISVVLAFTMGSYAGGPTCVSRESACRGWDQSVLCGAGRVHLQYRQCAAGGGDRDRRTGDCVSDFDRDCAGGGRGAELCAAAARESDAAGRGDFDGGGCGGAGGQGVWGAAAGGAVSRRGVVVCVISGLLMGIFAPFVTRAMTRGNDADAIYDSGVSYAGGVFVLALCSTRS